MKRITAILLAFVAAGAATVSAQDVRARVAPRAGIGGVEGILRLKEELELTDAQMNQLESIRREQVARKQEEARARIDLQSRIAAGLVRPEEVRAQFRERAGKLREQSEQTQDRIQKILTEEQRGRLREQRLRRALVAARMGRELAPAGAGIMPGRFGPMVRMQPLQPGMRRNQFGPPRFQPGARFWIEPRYRFRREF